MSEQVPFNLQRETLGSEGEAEPILVPRACRVRWRAGASGAVLAFVPDAEGRRDGEDSGEDHCECEEGGEDDECGA